MISLHETRKMKSEAKPDKASQQCQCWPFVSSTPRMAQKQTHHRDGSHSSSHCRNAACSASTAWCPREVQDTGAGCCDSWKLPQFPPPTIPTQDVILQLPLSIHPQMSLDAALTHSAAKSLNPGLNIWLCPGTFQHMSFKNCVCIKLKSSAFFRQPHLISLWLFSALFLWTTTQMLTSQFSHLVISKGR